MKAPGKFFKKFLNDKEKKWKKKIIMGIGWGLWHRKNLRAPVYLNHQSPQPNPHTFFFTITQSCQIQMRRTIIQKTEIFFEIKNIPIFSLN